MKVKLDIWGAATDPENADGLGLSTARGESTILELVPPLGTIRKITNVDFLRYIGFNASPGPYAGIPPKYRWGIIKQNSGQIAARILGEEFCEGVIGRATFENASGRIVDFANREDVGIPLNVGSLPIISFAGIVGIAPTTLLAHRVGDYGICTSDGQVELCNPAYFYNKKRYGELNLLDLEFAGDHPEPGVKGSREWLEWNRAKNEWKWEQYKDPLSKARLGSLCNPAASDGFSIFTGGNFAGIEEFTIKLESGLIIGFFANGILPFEETHPNKVVALGDAILKIYREENEAGVKKPIESAISLMRSQQGTECSIGHRPAGVAAFMTVL